MKCDKSESNEGDSSEDDEYIPPDEFASSDDDDNEVFDESDGVGSEHSGCFKESQFYASR